MTTVPRRRRAPGKKDRANARQAFVLGRAGDFDAGAVADAAQALVDAPPTAAPKARRAALPKGFPDRRRTRWVPIGPSVARRGQAGGRPRVNGRIRDIAVSSDGSRAYAASAMGGVWYSSDGGATWAPVGGWADRAARAGGSNNAQSCGCLLVTFGATVADDLVMVGTGETIPDPEPSGEGAWGGLGVLAAKGPADQPIGANPWEGEAGAAVLEGLGVFQAGPRPRRGGRGTAVRRRAPTGSSPPPAPGCSWAAAPTSTPRSPTTSSAGPRSRASTSWCSAGPHPPASGRRP